MLPAAKLYKRITDFEDINFHENEHIFGTVPFQQNLEIVSLNLILPVLLLIDD